VILTPKVRKTLDRSIRLAIATLSLSYIVYHIHVLSSAQLETFLHTVLGNKLLIVQSLFILVLMFINWGLESLKWKLLVKRSEEVGLWMAFQAVLGGLAVSVFTPNRVGEFFGRVFILKKTDPIKAILLTIVGSFAQLLVTMVLGTLAYMCFAPRYFSSEMLETQWISIGFAITLFSISLAMTFLFFNISFLHRINILLPEKYNARIRNSIDAIADCPTRLLLITLLLSTARYVVFTVQFYLAIQLMGSGFSFKECLLVIPVIYLVLAAIPTIALTELGVRGSVSVFLFGMLVGPQGLDAKTTLTIVLASSLIWFTNIALPSLSGVLVIFRLKFFRR